MIQLIKPDNSVIQFNDNVNYWWVNQGQTFNNEIRSGFMQSRPDDCLQHHLTLSKTRIGDIVIHYAGNIRAISIITREQFFITDYDGGHRRNECQYYLLQNPFSRDTARNILDNGLGDFPRPPFRDNGWVALGYLYHLSGELARNGDCDIYSPTANQKAISKQSFDLLFPNPILVL